MVGKLRFQAFNQDAPRIYLNSVGVISRVLKEAIVRIENFSGQQEEKFARRSPIIQAFFTIESDVQTGFRQLLFGHGHDFVEGILQ